MAKEVFGTKEWSNHSVNIITGCKHNCKYCYAKCNFIRFGRGKKEDWEQEKVKDKELHKAIRKKEGVVMFPTTHDITPENLPESIYYIGKHLKAGNNLLIVSTPHYICISTICDIFDKYKTQILFRFTIGSTDNECLLFWEPYAPAFMERINCLGYAFSKGYKTSVSCEPMLDNNIVEVIKKSLPMVTDAIWLGKMNMVKARLSANKEMDEETKKRAEQLIEWQSNENIKALYEKYKDNPKIKWKESIKKVIGIEVSTESGLDI